MCLLLFILLPTVTLTDGKQTLLATVEGDNINSSVIDIVAIDPTKGNVSRLYQLPLSGPGVCMKIDSKRNLIRVLVNDDDLSVGQSFLHEFSLVDGHIINTFNISKNSVGTSELYTQWDYDSDTSTLYGLCLNQSGAMYWNYTWCSVKFDENGGSGETKYGFYVSVDDDPPGPGPCWRVPMNRNTFSTGEYWYSIENILFVRHVTSPMGEPGEILWTIEGKIFDVMKFAALVIGKTNEYAIVVRAPLIDHENEGMTVVKLKSGGDEEIIAKLPASLIPMGPGGVLWDYDHIDKVLYLLMHTNVSTISNTLVKVNLTQPTNSGSSSFHTMPVSLNLLFDPLSHFVDEIHLVEWPPITLDPN